MDINKIIFLDIETAGQHRELLDTSERTAELWRRWQDKRQGEDPNDDRWVAQAGLHAEFGRVVCVSFGYFDKSNGKRLVSFFGENEHEILVNSAKVLNNSDAKGMSIGGHHVERFDIPYLWKRMLSLGVNPPSLITHWNKKPWDVKVFDTAKVWGNAQYKESMVSLDVLANVFGLPSPKRDLRGDMVHDAFWRGEHERIKEYCEADVVATMDIASKILEMVEGKVLYSTNS